MLRVMIFNHKTILASNSQLYVRAFTNPATELSILMLSIIVVIYVCGLLGESESV